MWAAVTFMFVLSFLGYQGLRQRTRSLELVRASCIARARIEALDAALRRAESAQQGFLLTGSDHTATEYLKARQAIGEEIAELSLVGPGPEQRARVDSVGRTVRTLIGIMDTLVEVRRTQGAAAARLAARAGPTAMVMNGIGHRIEAVRDAQRADLIQREAFDRKRFRTMVLVMIGGTLAAGVVASTAALMASRHASAVRQLHTLLASSAVEWRATFDAIDLPVLIMNHDFTVRRLNLSAALLTGRPPAEVIGKRVQDLAPSSLWKGVRDLIDRVVTSSTVQAGEVTVPEEDRRWQFEGFRVSLGNDDPCVILVGQERTSVFALQKALHQREVMSAIGVVAAGVAHEVRNPLQAIEALGGAFEAKFAQNSAVGPFIKHLRRQVVVLGRLMAELLEYGQSAQPERVPAQLDAACTAAFQRCETTALTAGVDLWVEIHRGLPAVMLDEERMVRAIENLVRNALQHTPRGGRVTVITDFVEAQGSMRVRCAVTDTGPGFPPEDLPKVFQPFFSKRRGGTGLGLSIAQRIVHEHGGILTASNMPQGGAVLSFSLPVAS